jgi:phosphosulfolactate phosphohydrolase-like enzyme
LYTKQQDFQKTLPRVKITITLRDGKEVEGVSFDTSPLDIAKKYMKKSLVPDLLAAKVNFIF